MTAEPPESIPMSQDGGGEVAVFCDSSHFTVNNQGGTITAAREVHNHVYNTDSGDEFAIRQLCKTLPTLFVDLLAQYRDDRAKGTCEWSKSDPIIGKWLNSDTFDTSRLWIHGGPGTGKTMLAAYLIDTKETERSQDEVVFYAFCKTQGGFRATSGSILLGFLRQYLDHCRAEPNILNSQTIKDLRGDMCYKPDNYMFTFKQLGPHFKAILKLFKKSCFIIDGLDECDETEVFAPGGLIDILSNLDMPTRLLFLGRWEGKIGKRLGHMPQVEMGADGTTQGDIREFVNDTVNYLASEISALEPSKSRLRDGLLRMAGNMFLLVKLEKSVILEKYPSSPAAVKKTLDSLDRIPPQSLQAVYHTLFSTKREKWKDVRLEQVAIRSLQWLLYSRTPVTQSFLRVVVAIDAKSGVLCLDDLEFSIEDTVKTLLGALVDWRKSDDGEVHATLVHSSFREYVISQKDLLSPGYMFETCCAVLRSTDVRDSLEIYHRSADKRRQGYGPGTELRQVLCQEEGWEIWEKRQLENLHKQKQWRMEEEKRVREELDNFRYDGPPEYIEIQDTYLKLLQGTKDGEDQELHALTGMLHLPVRELMIYALKFLPYHLSQVLLDADTTTTTATVPIITQMEVLVKDINLHASSLIGQVDVSQHSTPCCNSAIIDLSLALQSLAATTDAIERLLHEDQIQKSHFHRLTLYIYTYCTHFWVAQSSSSTDPKAIWNDAAVPSFESDLPIDLMHVFTLVTLALTNLQNIELALHNFDEHVKVVGSSILVHTLRRTAHTLSLWMTIYGHLRAKKEDEGGKKLIQVLLEDSCLYPKLLQSPKKFRCIEPPDIGVVLFDYDLWDRYAIQLSFAVVLCFIAGMVNSLLVLTGIILMLLHLEGQRYSFQSHRPMVYRVIHTFPSILVAVWFFPRFRDAMALGALSFCLQLIGLVRFRYFKTHGALYFQAEIIDVRLRKVVELLVVDRGLTHYTVWVGLAVILFAKPSFNSALEIAAVYFATKRILLGAVDPTGLHRARVRLKRISDWFQQSQNVESETSLVPSPR